MRNYGSQIERTGSRRDFFHREQWTFGAVTANVGLGGRNRVPAPRLTVARGRLPRPSWHFRPPKRITIGMDANASLTVRVGRSGSKYFWQFYREGIIQKVKYSGPIYLSEESAMSAVQAARTFYLARLERQKQRDRVMPTPASEIIRLQLTLALSLT
jgi:hypothetical protein